MVSQNNRAPIQTIYPGEFNSQIHFVPRALSAKLHPVVSSFLSLGNDRILARYCQLNPQVDKQALNELLAYVPSYLEWAGSDLLHVTTPKGHRQMIIIETNSCPAGQSRMPLVQAKAWGFENGNGHDSLNSGHKDLRGYGVLSRRLVVRALRRVPQDMGALAVVFDKNPQEARGYASAIAEITHEPVHLVQLTPNEPNLHAIWRDGVLHIRDDKCEVTITDWVPIRLAFRYVTQKPWKWIPVITRTVIINASVACLAGGRNKSMAARAYEALNDELSRCGANLCVQTPRTILDVEKQAVPETVATMGGLATVKVPYGNAGQGVYTITSEEELEAFMKTAEHFGGYSKFLVQSLVGRPAWRDGLKTSVSAPFRQTVMGTGEGWVGGMSRVDGRKVTTLANSEVLYHVGTIPNQQGDTFVVDLRMVVTSGEGGFVPVTMYARRARKPLSREGENEESSNSSWEMLGTNLSGKKVQANGEIQWSTDHSRLMLIDEDDFETLGLGIDDLIDAYVQTVLSVIAIDKQANRLVKATEGGSTGTTYTFDVDLFKQLNSDEILLMR